MPSPRQISYITDLKAERDVTRATGHVAALLERPIERLVGREPSHLIDGLLALPRRPREASSRPVPEHLQGLPASRYAFTWERLHLAGLSHLAGTNQQAFFRVKDWHGRVFLDQLHGAHPSFTRSRLAAADECAVASLIREDPHAATLEFSKRWTCCSRCGADLTDQESIDAGLGPTCRGYFGL